MKLIAQAKRDDDPFFPPAELQESCDATLAELTALMPPQPETDIPTTVNGPSSYDKSTSIEVMNACTQWLEFLGTQIGVRKAHLMALQASVRWMDMNIKYTHKGKLDKLTQAQFERYQSDVYSSELLGAQIALLETRETALVKAFSNASRNLTGLIKQ